MCVGKECQTRVSFTAASLYPMNSFMQTAYKTYSDLLTVKIEGHSSHITGIVLLPDSDLPGLWLSQCSYMTPQGPEMPILNKNRRSNQPFAHISCVYRNKYSPFLSAHTYCAVLNPSSNQWKGNNIIKRPGQSRDPIEHTSRLKLLEDIKDNIKMPDIYIIRQVPNPSSNKKAWLIIGRNSILMVFI